MRSRIIVPPGAGSIISNLRGSGFDAYAVGGCVRDTLLGKAPNDWDIATSARPDEVARVFARDRVVPTGEKHGTMTVIRGGAHYEVTTFRTESGYADRRRPDSVTFVGELSDDLSRRDFTVNAMAAGESGEVVDLFGGVGDLGRGIIRAVGDARTRFGEDALRIIRALRFASALEFDIEPSTAAALRELSPTLSVVSAERVRDELVKLLAGRGALRVWREFPEAFEAVLPELRGRIPERALPASITLLIGAEWTRRLRFDGASVRRHEAIASRAGAELPSDRAGMARLLGELGPRAMSELYAARGVGGAEEFIASDPVCRVGQLAVTGRDLISLGVPEGERVGRTLRALLENVVDGKATNNRAALLPLAIELAAANDNNRENNI